MAGPNTDVVCNALEALGLEPKNEQGPPGSGVGYGVTQRTLNALSEVHRHNKTVVVQDSGEVIIE